MNTTFAIDGLMDTSYANQPEDIMDIVYWNDPQDRDAASRALRLTVEVALEATARAYALVLASDSDPVAAARAHGAWLALRSVTAWLDERYSEVMGLTTVVRIDHDEEASHATERRLLNAER